MKRIIFIGLILIVITVSGTIFYVFNKPHRKAEDEDAAYIIQAEQLFKEYEADESLANSKYLDKVIEVKGIVTKVQVDQNNNIVLILNDNGGTAGVSCSIDPGSRDDAKNLKEGQEVSLKGICTGGEAMFGVTLNKSKIIIAD